MVEEINLLKRAQALDEEALAEIHDKYFQGIYRYFSFRMPDPQTAEDLTSEVFIRFLKAIREKIRHLIPSRVGSLVQQEMLLGNITGGAKKTEVVSITEQIPARENSPEQKISKRLDVEAMMMAMEKLTDDQKHVLALRFGYGLPIREVAEIVNKSEAAVKMLQARAIMTLTNQMDPKS